MVAARPAVASRLLPLAGIAAMLAVLELAPRAGLVNPRYFPPVSDSLSALGDLLGQPGTWTAIGNTAQGWAIGLAIAVAIGVPVGVVVGSSRLLHRALRAVIEFLRPIPSVALIPLAILIWGSGLESKVFLAAFAATWPVLMQTLYGVQDVDPVALDTARAFGFPRGQRMLRVTLPSAVPYIATGVRISAAVALILAVTAELVIGSAGLGREINLARQGGAVAEMYALIAITGLFGWAVNGLFSLVERRVLRWHPSQRRQEVAR